MSISLSLIAVAMTLASPSPTYTYSALLASSYVQLPKAHVAVLSRDCPAFPDGSNISCVYQAKPDVIYTKQNNGRIFLHELGHVFDFTTMQEWQRAAFRLIMRDDRPWYTKTRDQPGLMEVFADAYATCAMGFTSPRIANFPVTSYNYNPTPEQQHQVCKLLSPRTKAKATRRTRPLT